MFERFKRAVGAVVLAGALSPENLQANNQAVAKAKISVANAQRTFDAAKEGSEEEKKADKKLTEAKDRLAMEEAKLLDEKTERENKKSTQPTGDPDTKFGNPYGKESELSVSSEVEMDIYEAGKKVGTKKVVKGSKIWVDLEKKRIKAERDVGKEKAKHHTDQGGAYNRNGVFQGPNSGGDSLTGTPNSNYH